MMVGMMMVEMGVRVVRYKWCIVYMVYVYVHLMVYIMALYTQ